MMETKRRGEVKPRERTTEAHANTNIRRQDMSIDNRFDYVQGEQQAEGERREREGRQERGETLGRVTEAGGVGDWRPEVLWESVGERVPEGMIRAADVVAEAGLDWEVRKVPAFMQIGLAAREEGVAGYIMPTQEDRFAEVAGHFFTVRSDREGPESVLGAVGQQYEPLQNVALFELGEALFGEAGATYETAGVLDGGSRVWALAKYPFALEVPTTDGPDVTEMHLLLTTCHDGSGAFTAAVTPIRVICANTLIMALAAAAQRWSIRHTRSATDRIREAERALALVAENTEALREAALDMVAVRITEEEWTRLVAHLLPSQTADGEVSGRTRNQRQVLDRQMQANPTVNLPGQSWSRWAAYNAVTVYADHHRGSRKTNLGSVSENRLKSVWFGSGASLKAKAWSLLREGEIPPVQEVRVGVVS